MVKPPKIKHSRSRRDPPTIDLEAENISRADPARAGPEPQDVAAAAASARDEPSGRAAEPLAQGDGASTQPITSEGQVGPAAPGTSGEESAERPEPSDTPPPEAAASAPPRESPASQDSASPPPESVRHAFGRDPGAAGPGAARTGFSEPKIRPAPPRRGTAAPIVAGLAGAILALAGAAALQWGGLLPVPAAESPGEAAALAEQVRQIRSDLDAVKAAAPPTDPALSQAMDALSAGLEQAKADIAALKDAVAAGGAGDGAAVQALGERIAGVEASVAALQKGGSAAASGPAAGPQLAEVQAAVAALQQNSITKEALDAVSAQLEQLAATVSANGEQATVEAGRLAALEDRVAALGDTVAGQQAQPKVALAIAGAALKSAVERGGTFASEVETFAALAPDSPELASLRELAQKGVPSARELAEGMDEAATAMIAAARTVPEDAGLWDRLWSSAKSIVSVRPVGPVEGDSVAARVARMEVAVQSDDLPKALAEFDALPQTSKAAGQTFADTIRARANAQDLVARALAGALKAAGA